MTSMIFSSRADTGLAQRLEQELMRARASSPFHARASVWLGELALARGHAPEALRFLEEADRIAPDTPRLALALGRAYERTGQPDKAHAAYTRALHQPEDADEARRVLQQGSF
jgi:Flp pilus assembly protein TadD